MPIFLLILDFILCSIIFKKSDKGEKKWNMFKKCTSLCAGVNLIGVIIGFIIKEKDFLYNSWYIVGYISATFIISLCVGVLIGFGINYLLFRKKFK